MPVCGLRKLLPSSLRSSVSCAAAASYPANGEGYGELVIVSVKRQVDGFGDVFKLFPISKFNSNLLSMF